MTFDNLGNKCTIDIVNVKHKKYIVQHTMDHIVPHHIWSNTYCYNKTEIHKMNINMNHSVVMYNVSCVAQWLT
jgi:hypothetical protein